ncbi:MAG TPA: hypothetical protein VLR94_09455 [Acidobacteriota bacterium]|nr:hypothetical protein [Acidobacteriota bacterium]
MAKLKSTFPFFFAAAATAVISGIHGQLLEAFASVLLLAALCATAYPATRYLFGPGAAPVLFAFPAGYVIHSLGLSLAAWAGGFRPLTLAAYMSAAILVAALTWRKAESGGEIILPWERSDRYSLLLWLAATVAVTAPAFLNVGVETPQGYAYRAYFNTDVFRNIATAGSLARTGIPPENPYFTGHTLHYYWLFHVIPGFWTTILPGFRAEFLFVQFAMATALAFVAALWAAVRSLSSKAVSTLWVLPLFLVGGSYEGLYVLKLLHDKKIPWQQFTTLNVDGILRWVDKLPQVDTLFRPLLYAPQHLAAVIVCLMFFLLRPRLERLPQRLLLLGFVFTSVGFSVIVGAITVLAVGILLLADAARRKQGVWIKILGATVVGLVFLALYLKGFYMFKLGQGDLKLVLQEELLRRLPAFFLYQWGALVFFGTAGIIFWKRKDFHFTVLSVFLALSTIFIIFIRIDVPGLSDVSLKAGYVHHVAMVLFAAKFLDQIRTRRLLLPAALAIAVVPASITWMMDGYNSQDVTNPRFTTYIERPQMELYRWMRRNLDARARVQDFFLRESSFIESYVSETPPFANRSVVLGDVILSQIFQTPQDELERRAQMVDNLVESEDVRRIAYLAHRAGIQYLVSYPRPKNPLDADDARRHFQLVVEMGEWRLFRVLSHEVSLYYERGEFLVYDDDESKPLLTSVYASGFHPVESLPDGEPARWMSQDGEIQLHSEKEMRGTLMFLAHSYSRNRTLDFWWNGVQVSSAAIGLGPTKVVVPLKIPSGRSEIRIHCAEGAQKGPGADNRQLSLKIWELQLRLSE